MKTVPLEVLVHISLQRNVNSAIWLLLTPKMLLPSDNCTPGKKDTDFSVNKELTATASMGTGHIIPNSIFPWV